MIRTAFAVLVLLAAGCGGGDQPPEPRAVTFQFFQPSHDERFVARTADPAVIAEVRAELSKPFEERTLHINGSIAKGADINAPWSWHFVEGEWRLAEMSIEACDGWPGYLEGHLDEWLSQISSFCPWTSRVEREVEP